MAQDKPRLTDVARVDEKTVQKVARGEKVRPRTRKHRPERRGPPLAVTAVKVDPEVWDTAKGLTHDPRCIQIVSEEEVIVWNHGPPWPTGGKPDL